MMKNREVLESMKTNKKANGSTDMSRNVENSNGNIVCTYVYEDEQQIS
jgi:hypothetical protein